MIYLIIVLSTLDFANIRSIHTFVKHFKKKKSVWSRIRDLLLNSMFEDLEWNLVAHHCCNVGLGWDLRKQTSFKDMLLMLIQDSKEDLEKVKN